MAGTLTGPGHSPDRDTSREPGDALGRGRPARPVPACAAPRFFAELFPADRRYTGAAAGREIASILAGGLTPFIATAPAGPDGTRCRWWPATSCSAR